MTPTTENITAPDAQRITLYYREGSSDNLYQAAIRVETEKALIGVRGAKAFESYRKGPGAHWLETVAGDG